MRRQRFPRPTLHILESRIAPAGLVAPPRDAGPISSVLTQIRSADKAPDWMIADPAGNRLGVRLTGDDVRTLRPALDRIGFEQLGVSDTYHTVEGWLPAASVGSLNALVNQGLWGAVAMIRPGTGAGNVTSEATAIQSVERVRWSDPTLTGAGVRLAVISDSFNRRFDLPTTMAQDVASKDLPGAPQYSPVDVVLEGPVFDGNTTSPNVLDEGRAMLQLVHDVAPGATLGFASGFFSEMNMAAQINALATTWNAGIICDDIFWKAEPMFQDGPIARAIDSAGVGSNVLYFALAGNFASQAYERTSFPLASDPLFSGTFLNFAQTGTDTRQLVTIPAGGKFEITLNWDDPFENKSGMNTDLDLLLVQPGTSNVIASSTVGNLALGLPYEFLSMAAPSNATLQGELLIRLTDGAAPTRIKYLNYGANGQPSTWEYDTNSPALSPHTAASQAISVAAVDYRNQRNPANYTSLGPHTLLFDQFGSPLPAPLVRNKPDIAAVADINTTFFGTDSDGDGNRNFAGTSAATPHAAAIGALLKQKYFAASPAFLVGELKAACEDIGTPGIDALSGAGLLNAFTAINGKAAPTGAPITVDFESGSLGANWITYASGAGRVRVTDAWGPLGAKHLILDALPNTLATKSGAEAELLIAINGPGSVLTFSARSVDDDPDPLGTTSFAGHRRGDGVSVSPDGLTWYPIVELGDGSLTKTYKSYTVNLFDECVARGFLPGFKTRIRFQQADNDAAEGNGDGDGIAFDNIQITGPTYPPGGSLLYWDGEGLDGNFNNTKNWYLDATPGPNDRCVIDESYTIHLTGSFYAVKSLYITGKFNVAGGYVSVAETATFGSGITISGGGLAITGQANIIGSLTMTGGGLGAGTAVVTGATAITNATLTVNSTGTLAGGLALHSGTLDGNGTVTLVGNSTWSNGSMASAGTTIIPAGSKLTMDQSGRTVFHGRVIDVRGTLAWSSGSVGGPASFIVRSGGVVDIECDAQFYDLPSYGWSNIINQSGGLIRKSKTAGDTYIRGTITSTGGTFDIQTGTLTGGASNWSGANKLQSGTLRFSHATGFFANSASVTGAGKIELTGGEIAVEDGHQVSLDRLTITSGNLYSGPNAKVTIVNRFDWLGGSQSGSGTTELGFGCVGVLGGTDRLVFNGHMIQSAADITWTSGNLGGPGTWVNAPGSVLNIECDAQFYDLPSYGWSNLVNQSGGLIRKSKSAGDTYIRGTITSTGGTFDIQTGTLTGGAGNWSGGNSLQSGTVRFSHATGFFAHGTTVTGAGKIELTGGEIAVASGLAANLDRLTITAGNLYAGTNAKVTIVHRFDWTGGSQSGSGTTSLGFGCVGVLAGTDRRVYDGHVILSEADITWSSGNLGGPGTWVNAPGSVLNIECDAQFYDLPSYGWSHIINQSGGLIRKSKTAGDTYIRGAISSSGGTFDIQTGTLTGGAGNWSGANTLQSGTVRFSVGSAIFAHGTNVTGAGTLQIIGGDITIAAGDTVSLDRLQLASGAFVVHSGATANIVHRFDWTGGSLQGAGTTSLQPMCAGVIAGGNHLIYHGHTVDNRGSLTWSAGDIGGPGNFVNSAGGNFQIATDADMYDLPFWGWSNIKNQFGATLTYSAPAGFGSIRGGMTNAGAVHVITGTLSPFGIYTQTTGMTRVLGTLAASTSVDLQGGTLEGTGTITSPVAASAGTIAPGASPGTLTIGNLTSAVGANHHFEIAGKGGGQFDVLTVQGGVSLGGVLTVVPGYAAQVGDSFVILSNDGTDAITGTWAGLPEGGKLTAAGIDFQVSYLGGTGNDVSLTVTQVTPPPTATIVVDAGTPQRSVVRSYSLTFSQSVTIADPAAAFQLQRTGPGGPVGNVNLAFVVTPTSVVISFNDPVYAPGPFGSLIDGAYSLTVTGSEILAGGLALDADNDGLPGGVRTVQTHRLFGDFNGDRMVNTTDFLAFRLVFLSSEPAFDFDGNGSVDTADFLQFRLRFLQTV